MYTHVCVNKSTHAHKEKKKKRNQLGRNGTEGE